MFIYFSYDLANPNSCSYGSNILYSMENMNTFNFKQNPQAASPFIFSIAWNRPSLVRDFNPLFKFTLKKNYFDLFSIQPRFYLKFFAIDDDSERSLVFIADQSKLIDYYVIDYNANQNIIPTGGLSTQLNWLEFPLKYGESISNTFQTQ